MPEAALAHRTLSLGIVGSHPRGDFATGWWDGFGAEGRFRWSYWRSVEASVSLSLIDHAPKVEGDPEVLVGVVTLGVHWLPRLARGIQLDVMAGAQSHTALFHEGLDVFEGDKGFDESDLGFCFGIGLERRLAERWGAGVTLKTNAIFTQPEWVHYETITAGVVYALIP